MIAEQFPGKETSRDRRAIGGMKPKPQTFIA